MTEDNRTALRRFQDSVYKEEVMTSKIVPEEIVYKDFFNIDKETFLTAYQSFCEWMALGINKIYFYQCIKDLFEPEMKFYKVEYSFLYFFLRSESYLDGLPSKNLLKIIHNNFKKYRCLRSVHKYRTPTPYLNLRQYIRSGTTDPHFYLSNPYEIFYKLSEEFEANMFADLRNEFSLEDLNEYVYRNYSSIKWDLDRFLDFEKEINRLLDEAKDLILKGENELLEFLLMYKDYVDSLLKDDNSGA